MRPGDYPPPSYAFHCWHANGRIWLTARGKTYFFEDTPDGLAELRIALLAAREPRLPLGPARASGSNLREPPEVDRFKNVKRLTARGRAKLETGDLWSEQEETSNGL